MPPPAPPFDATGVEPGVEPGFEPDFEAEPDRFGEVSRGMGFATRRMAYADWGPRDAPVTVVCVHGLTRQGRDFDPLAAALAASGARVICPDLPGRGRSGPLPSALDYTLAGHCDDLRALLATLGGGPVHWVGTSLGGMIGMALAASGTPIAKLVVNDIGPEVPASATTRVFLKLSRAPGTFASLDAAERFFRRNFTAYGELSDAHWRHVTRHSVREVARGRFRWLFDRRIAVGLYFASILRPRLWREWARVTAPTLIIRGERSDFLDRATARRMLDTNRGARLIEIEGVGHMPMLATAAEIETIHDFLLRP